MLEVEANLVAQDTKIGDSIATNGVCLTVTCLHDHGFTADVMPETVERTALGQLQPGSLVNLERALTLHSRLGGHIVSGHIDGTGRIAARRQPSCHDARLRKVQPVLRGCASLQV